MAIARRFRVWSNLWLPVAAACAAAWAPNASAILLDRGPDMVYDTVLDITWLRNANLAGPNLTFAQANLWADLLVVDGVDDWRLPRISVSGLNFPAGATSLFQIACGVGGPGSTAEIACRDDELAYMYWYNFQQPNGAAPQPGINLTGSQVARGGEAISNVQQRYWSGTGFEPNDPDSAWLVNFGGFGTTPPGGYFDAQPKAFPLAAWAVRDGDVLAIPPVSVSVPEPASLGLLTVGFAALGLRRRRKLR